MSTTAQQTPIGTSRRGEAARFAVKEKEEVKPRGIIGKDADTCAVIKLSFLIELYL